MRRFVSRESRTNAVEIEIKRSRTGARRSLRVSGTAEKHFWKCVLLTERRKSRRRFRVTLPGGHYDGFFFFEKNRIYVFYWRRCDRNGSVSFSHNARFRPEAGHGDVYRSICRRTCRFPKRFRHGTRGTHPTRVSGFRRAFTVRNKYCINLRATNTLPERPVTRVTALSTPRGRG